MAIKVRLKDASGNVLHPETDWSLVQNKPSIKVDEQNSATWDSYGLDLLTDDTLSINTGVDTSISTGNEMKIKGGYIHLIANTSGEGNIYITDKTAGNKINLANYPISWSAINGKPSINIDSAAEVWKPTNKNISITSNTVNIGGTTSSKIFVLDSTTKTRTLLEDYPTAWKKVSNKPRAMSLFGYVFVKASTSSDADEYWPAVAVKDSYNHSDFDVYKFNGSGWVKGEASEFIAFTDTDSN